MPPLILGSVEPRIWTPPLRRLTRKTSFGFEVNDWARDTLRHPADPWQAWLNIHAGELLPDGRPRFRVVLVLVARQNGKTELLVILCLWWQFRRAVPLILGTSTKLDYAKESWAKTIKLAERVRTWDEDFAAMLPPADAKPREARWHLTGNGFQESWTLEGARYKIAAANEDGGRSLTVHRLILDELRQHHDYSAWESAEGAMSAVPDAQVWCLSNAGDVRSVVLNDLRAEAIRYIETGEGDPRVGIFEWSAPDDADPEDIAGLAQANPNMNHHADRGPFGDDLVAKARAAKRKGGQALTSFITNYLCRSVTILNPAIDAGSWDHKCADLDPVPPGRPVLCMDLSPDAQHATLTAAWQLPDGRYRVEPVEAWEGVGAGARALRALPALLVRTRARAIGWLPDGPMAAIVAGLKKRAGWPPRGVKAEPIRGETPAVCMGFAELVVTGQISHGGDPLQDAHVTSAERLPRPGGTWVFSRAGGHCDAAYAAAGAVHLVRTLPPPRPPVGMILPTGMDGS